MCPKPSNIVVFTQSSDISKVSAIMHTHISNNYLTILLSTHRLFEYERKSLLQSFPQLAEFITFSELLTDDDMEWCDLRAYELEKSLTLSSDYRLKAYYSLINTLKNQLVMCRINKRYEVREKYLMATDLGIAPIAWREARYVENIFVGNEPTSTPDMTLNSIRFSADIFSRISRTLDELYIIESKMQKLLFVGDLTRIGHRLGNVNIIQPFATPRFRLSVLSKLAMRFPLRLESGRQKLLEEIAKTLCALARKERFNALATSLHEYDYRAPTLSRLTGLPLVMLQDSYLPENLTSRYSHYYEAVDRFLVWDRLSTSFYANQGLRSEHSDIYRSMKLPTLAEQPQAVKKIVVIASSAGDWTALKNRSDAELLAEACAHAAATLPTVQFVYRVHPFSVHKEHQGAMAFDRVTKLFESMGLSNIVVSGEAKMQAKTFLNTLNLAIHPQSLTKDLQGADLVLGEHSIGMIDAARQGIPFASVNLTNRRNLFSSFTQLGFPHCTSVQEIVELVQHMGSSKDTARRYNRAVEIYNLQYAACKGEY